MLNLAGASVALVIELPLLRVATALMPTLIFTLVIATILRERFQIADALYGALLFYAGISTILPSLVLAKSVDLKLLAMPSAPPLPSSEPEDVSG